MTDLDSARDAILAELLANIAFDGWTDRSLRDAVNMAGLPAEVSLVAFPGGVREAAVYFSDWADRQMLAAIEADGAGFAERRIKDRVAFALRARLEAMLPYREAVRRSLPVLASPGIAPKAARASYRTVDLIWRACGDTATDFNFYTKRGLLAGVLATTTLYWLSDTSEDQSATWRFLDRRLSGVLRTGRLVGRLGGLGTAAEAPWRLAAAIRRRVVPEG